jgi:asparagine synthase (glutamine-hydrolysing)
MCGFVGAISFDPRHALSRQALDRMTDRIAHRGPDGRGQHFDPGPPAVALAHCRLAILDPDPRSNQPFTDSAGQGGRWIVFNGEIYNFRELRKELQSLLPQYPWRTEGDTEVLLAAYAAWGTDCLPRLDGMFALAIWDAPNRRLFLARDRMGQKPLYVAVDRWPLAVGREEVLERPTDNGQRPTAIAFASELAALREIEWVDRSLNPSALVHYLCWGYIPAPQSIHPGIQQLSPATWAIWQESGLTTGQYFDPAAGSQSANGQRPTANDPSHFPSRLRAAVQRQLISDVPLGCFLSGGIDSSVIALNMRDILGHGRSVHTFSIGFDDPRYDETPYATAVAKHLGTTHESFIIHPRVADDLPKLAAVFGEPFADSSALAVHYLSRQTRQSVKVALSGDGGDELFGGYDRYRALALAQRLPHGIKSLLSHPLWQHLPGTHPKSRLTRLKRFLATLNHPLLARYSAYMRLFDDTTLNALLHPDLKSHLPPAAGWLIGQGLKLPQSPRDPIPLATALDRITYLPNDLLTKLDRASMLHALEVRSPFMDPDLVSFAATLTGPQLIQGGRGGTKRLLRQAYAHRLPPQVFRRRKMGFALPLGQWFRTSLRPLLQDHLQSPNSFAAAHFNPAPLRRLQDDHHTARRDHTPRLYALLMLELWWKDARRD